MGLLVYLFDTRNLSPEKKNEVYEYIDRDAFMSNDVAVDNKFAGYIAYYEHDPSSYLAKIPYKCIYKDITGWNLEDIDYVFHVAFKGQP